jgi:hypothetical protein
MPDSPEPPPPPQHAPQFGLASLVLGAVVFVVAPVVLVLTTQIVELGRGSPSDAEIRAWLARVGVTGPFLIALLGAWLGVRGLQRHRVEGGSYALPLAGLVLCAVALLEWGVATYAVVWTVESMRR